MNPLVTYKLHITRMQEALKEARIAMSHSEVPVGAILFLDGEVVGRGHNSRIAESDPTGHAEIRAIREACKKIGNYRLQESSLYVTVEPCIMCVGAILEARVKEVVFGAREPVFGAAGSVINLLESNLMHHQCKVIAGVCADESKILLKKFFKKLRDCEGDRSTSI